MSKLVKIKSRRRKLKRSPVGLLLIILLWSLAMGWILALAISTQSSAQTPPINTVDAVPQRYQLGEQLYLENCATCHLALPPSVFPTQTWQNLLQDTEHYSVQLKPLVDPPRLLMWNYLRTFSRSLLPEEEIPYRINNSRYFKALHPKVDLPRPVQITSCVSCHPSAKEYNFRRLSSEWENSQ